MTLYKTVVTFRIRIGGQDHRTSLYSPEFNTEIQAVNFGKAFVEAGTAMAWRVVYRNAPDYEQILGDLGGRWAFGTPAHYLSEHQAKLPVFQPPADALTPSDPDLPEGWPDEWAPILTSPPDSVLVITCIEGTLWSQTLAGAAELYDHSLEGAALVNSILEDCPADMQSVWVAGPEGLRRIV